MTPRRPVLIVTHGRIGEELVALARELLGPIPHLEALSISTKDSLSLVSGRLEKWAGRISHGARGVILTDLKNSSASVCALALAKKYPVDCVCGVNLPILLKTLSPEEASLDDLVSAGRSGIEIVGKKR